MKLYPQKPPMAENELVDFLQTVQIARLGSVNPDGTVHISALWFQYDEGELVLGTQEVSKKVRNIKRNPQVTVLIDAEGPPLRGVLLYGQAELEYDDVNKKRITIFEKYMPHDDAVQFAEMMSAHFAPVIIRVRPDRVLSYDYGKEGMLPIGDMPMLTDNPAI